MIHKAVIVEDEDSAREILTLYLKNMPDIAVIGHANTGTAAIAEINQKNPDIVFLDIQLPEMNGFDVIGHLQVKPVIIFITAYDNYAVKAFEVNGIDYILKPVTKERLEQAVTKAKSNLSNFEDRLHHFLASYRQQQNYPRVFQVTDALHENYFISYENVFYFQAEDRYIKLYTYDQSYYCDSTLTELEKILDPEYFIRVSRKCIIAIPKIGKMKHDFWNTIIIMNDKQQTQIHLTRSYADTFKKHFSMKHSTIE